jgi:hypothetical protein
VKKDRRQRGRRRRGPSARDDVLAIIATECGREKVGIKLGIGMPIEYLGTLKQFYLVNESQVGVKRPHTHGKSEREREH